MRYYVITVVLPVFKFPTYFSFVIILLTEAWHHFKLDGLGIPKLLRLSAIVLKPTPFEYSSKI